MRGRISAITDRCADLPSTAAGPFPPSTFPPRTLLPMTDAFAEIDAIFHPRSVAVVGASANPDTPGYDYVKSMQEFGFKGDIYPVNPKGRRDRGAAGLRLAARSPRRRRLRDLLHPLRPHPPARGGRRRATCEGDPAVHRALLRDGTARGRRARAQAAGRDAARGRAADRPELHGPAVPGARAVVPPRHVAPGGRGRLSLAERQPAVRDHALRGAARAALLEGGQLRQRARPR